MDQTSFLFQNELYIKVDKKNNGTSKFLKMFESVNKEKESKENSSNDYYEEAFYYDPDVLSGCDRQCICMYELHRHERCQQRRFLFSYVCG